MNLEKAIRISITAHQGQVDKAGTPYILHPLRVMLACKTNEEQICAVLHDVIEDTSMTLEDLSKEGFSEHILNTIDALTRRSYETYGQFIERIMQDPIACKVKLADLADNMDLTRIANPTEKDYKRVEKYRRATHKIRKHMEENSLK